MNTGDRIDVTFTFPGCNNPAIYYGGSTFPGQFQTPLSPIPVPATPSSLTVTANSDGTATLSWNAPTTGAPVSFYRIYRGGQDYTNRYDVVDPTTNCTGGTCTYTDTKRNSGSTYSYSVTAVGGTATGASMAESKAIGPVTA